MNVCARGCVRRSGSCGRDGADCIDAVGQLCGDREHVLGAKASTTTMWRCVDERIDAEHLPRVRGAGRRPEQRPGPPVLPPLPGTGCTSISTPPWSSTTPTTTRKQHRPGRKPTVTTRCRPLWTAPRSPGWSPRRGAAYRSRGLQHRRRPRQRPGSGLGIPTGAVAA